MDIIKDIDLSGDEYYIILVSTDSFDIVKATSKEEVKSILNDKGSKLTAFRIFNSDGEFRGSRDDLSQAFLTRSRIDTAPTADYYDDLQYIDSKDLECIVKLTGNTKVKKVRIRSYLEYNDKSGMAYVADWRYVGFEEE